MKVRYPEARDIVGIETGPPEDGNSAGDLLYLDARESTEEQQREAEKLQRETAFLTRIIRSEGEDYPTYLLGVEINKNCRFSVGVIRRGPYPLFCRMYRDERVG